MAKTIWCVYNHRSSGDLCTTHFTDYKRKKKVGDNREEEVFYSAQSQLDGFRKSDYVSLFQDGTVKHNQVLVFDGSFETEDDPRAAIKIAEWARKKGISEIPSPEVKEVKEKANALEDRISTLEKNVDKILSKLDNLVGASK